MLKRILNFSPGVIIPMVINFILTILYARFLQPGEYGILNVYLNTIQIVYAVTLSVFQNAALRYYSISDSYNGDSEFNSSYIFANIFTTVVIVPIAYFVSLFLDYNWMIVVLSVGANGLFQFICNYYRLRNKSNRYNFIRTFAAGMSIIILVIAANSFDPLSYIWSIIAVYGSYGIVAIISLLKICGSIKLRAINLNLLKESMKYGFPLIGVTVLGYIIANSDQYLILYFLDDEVVGNYALGYRLVDALIVNMLTMILLVMTPELNKKHDSEGEVSSSVTLTKMINAAVWIILPISFAIIVYANYIIQFIFPEYINAAEIMRLVVFASIFHGISMFTCKGLELEKHTKYIFWGLLAAALINIIYNIIFIPTYGVDASAHSSLLAYVLYNVLLVVFTHKYYDLRFDISYILRTMLATLVTALCAVILMNIWPINNIIIFLISGCICVLVYMIMSWLLKLFNTFK